MCGEPNTIMSTHVRFITQIPCAKVESNDTMIQTDEIALPEIKCAISGKVARETGIPSTIPINLATHVDRT